jgi:hypothetical protein
MQLPSLLETQLELYSDPNEVSGVRPIIVAAICQQILAWYKSLPHDNKLHTPYFKTKDGRFDVV